MNPTTNAESRRPRAKTMLEIHGTSEKSLFVDASPYAKQRAHAAAAVDATGKCINACTVLTTRIEEAEEVAIAMALTSTKHSFILSDSQVAIRNFAHGRISQHALRILTQSQELTCSEEPRYLIWFPAHTNTATYNPNETVHALSRELSRRAAQGVPSSGDGVAGNVLMKDRITSYAEYTKYYRDLRRIFPPPHPKLDRKQATEWRTLQTNSYPSPVQLHRMFPEIYQDSLCKACKIEEASLNHMLWGCPNQLTDPPEPLRERWRKTLLSSDLQDQTWAIQLAREASGRQGLLSSI